MDLADNVSAARGNLQSDFKFTSGNDAVTGTTATIGADDTLMDNSTTDNDVLSITALAANANNATIINIETFNVSSINDNAAIDFTNVSGVKNVNVTGTGNVALNDIDAANLQPTIAINNYAQIATVNVATLAGTTAASSAETVNLSVSGATWGTTAATQSGLTITTDNTGTLETLNITSTGSAANTYTLDADTVGAAVVLSTVNLLGTAAQTVRVSDADISGITVVGSAATGDTAVRINRDGRTTNATNVANFTDVDNIIVADDNATPAAALVLASLKSGQKVTVVDDMATASSLSFQGSTRAAPAASLTLVLDNDTAIADVDFAGTLDIQNVATLNLVSNGVTATATSDVNNFVGALTGDFTTITITGDTRIDFDALTIDAAGADADVARTVVVNASGLTGLADIDVTVGASTLVSYEITGSANGDALVLNAAGGVLDGGAGSDALTGGAGDDEIIGGTGNDTITASGGADTLTGGTGNDTIDINATTSATAQQGTILLAGAFAAGDRLAITIDGVTKTYTVSVVDVAGTGAEDLLAISRSISNFINQSFDQVTSSADTATTTVVAAEAGVGFTLNVVTTTAGDGDDTTAEAAVANATEIGFNITDFSSTDVLDVSTILGAVVYEESADIATTAADTDSVIVLTGASYASVAAAEDAVFAAVAGAGALGNIDGVIVFLNSTTGKAQAFYDNDLDTDGTLADTAVLATFDNITTLAGIASTFSSDSFI